MPKVLIIATSRKTKGGISSVIESHMKGEHWDEFKCHWVETHRDGSILRKATYFFSGLADYIVRLPFYDIVHVHVSQPMTIRRKSIFLRLAKILKKKVVTHFHAFNTEDTIKGEAQESYRRFFNESDVVIVLSKWWKNQLIEGLAMTPDKIKVLYNPCPTVSLEKIPQEKVILYAGAVNERKGYKDLLKAFSKIAGRYPDWRVILAGNGDIEFGKNMAKGLGIEKQVEFAGWVTGKDKENLYRKARLFCLPSYAEGFPMAVLEAWAYGLPVITTPVGGIPDVAIDGKNMLLFKPGDTGKLAENIERLINDEGLRTSISKASKEFANGQFNIRTINKELEDIYRSLDNKG